jgi:hypothetical protein
MAAAAAAAADGAERTKDMMAQAGRARWMAERAQGTMDGGAHLTALLFATAGEVFAQQPWNRRR